MEINQIYIYYLWAMTSIHPRMSPRYNKYYKDCDVRLDKFRAITDSIVWKDPCYRKEKYGRYDTSYYGHRAGVVDRLLEEVEDESEKCCQYCWRHLPQVWLDTWWIIHLCWRHALCGWYTKWKIKIKDFIYWD